MKHGREATGIWLCERLRDPAKLSDLALGRSTSEARTLSDLVDGVPFDVIEDDSRWNQHPGFMTDIAGGMTPDVVLRSKLSGQNRIFIEVKKTRALGYGRADSQVVRYFLHLIATTERKPAGAPTDIRRAVMVAAPPSWFAVRENGDTWNHFLTTFSKLAAAFDVTLAELQLPEQIANVV